MSSDFEGVTIGSPVQANQLNALAARAERIARLCPGCCHTTYIGYQGYTTNTSPPKTTYTATLPFLAFAPSVVLGAECDLVVVPAAQLNNNLPDADYPMTAADLTIKIKSASGKSPSSTVTQSFVNATLRHQNYADFPLQTLVVPFDMSSTSGMAAPVGAWIGMSQTGSWDYDGNLCHFFAMVVPVGLNAEPAAE